MVIENTLPQKSFERNMNHNYMILGRCDFFHQKEDVQDYRVRMLLDNKISGLLPVSHRMVNGENKYYYEINSLQSMDRVYAKDEMNYHQLCSLLRGCIRLYQELEEYLLDGSQIILKQEYIYLNMDTSQPYFVYFPDYDSDARDSFADFIEELLRKVDHTDERAVMLAYQVYRYTRNQNYILGEIAQMLESRQDKKPKEEPPKKQPLPEPLREQPIEEPIKEAIKEPQPHFDAWEEDTPPLYQEEKTDEGEPPKDDKYKKNMKYACICFAIGVCALGLIKCSATFGMLHLNEKQTLYLYGASGMSLMAGVIFLACYFKKKNRAKEIQELEAPQKTRTDYAEKSYEPKLQKDDVLYPEESYFPKQESSSYGDTTDLGQFTEQEPFLYGMVNGKEVNVKLDRLPMIIGKMEGKADCIIADNTVSKLHAKITQMNGDFYVEDLNSTNGTLRNGVMIGMNEPVLLQAGDELTLGGVSLKFCR